MSTFTFYEGSRPRPQHQYLPHHGNDKTMAKSISKEPKAPAPTKPKAGRISKKKVKSTNLDTNLFEPIPITAIEHIATRVRFAENIKTTKTFRNTSAILNPTTIKTSNAAIASILKVRLEPNLVTIPMDALSAIPDANIKEEPAEEEATTIILEGSPVWDYPTNTITEEPTEEEATTNHVTIPTDVYNTVFKKEPADQAAEEMAVDHEGKPPPPPKPTSSSSSTKSSSTKPSSTRSSSSTKPSSSTKSSSSTKPAPKTKTKPSSSTKSPSTKSSTKSSSSIKSSSSTKPATKTKTKSSSKSSSNSSSNTKPKLNLNPEHLLFNTTANPALNSHHLLQFHLTPKHYQSLKGPLAKILKKKGLRTQAQRFKITAFKPEHKDSQSKYLVEGIPYISGAAASNKVKEPKLIRPEWLLGGPLECGKCGSSYGREENTNKQNRKQLKYHQGLLTKRSRAKDTHGELLQGGCKAAGPLIYY